MNEFAFSSHEHNGAAFQFRKAPYFTDVFFLREKVAVIFIRSKYILDQRPPLRINNGPLHFLCDHNSCFNDELHSFLGPFRVAQNFENDSVAFDFESGIILQILHTVSSIFAYSYS